MKVYEVIAKVGYVILSENPARRELEEARIAKSGDWLVPDQFHTWLLHDNGDITVYYKSEGRLRTIKLVLALAEVYTEDIIRGEVEGYAKHYKVPESAVDVTVYRRECDNGIIGFRLSLNEDYSNRYHRCAYYGVCENL